MERRRRTQGLCAIAVVLGLHLAVVWMLLATSRRFTRQAEPQSMNIVFVAQSPISLRKPLKGQVLEKAPGRHRAAASPPLMPHAATKEDGSNAILPPTDWTYELSRAAKNAATAESANKTRDFGFPHSPATLPDKPSDFGWDYAATHRVETLPKGGLLMHFNDNCVLIFSPLPFGQCAIGKRQANGDLFRHMNDTPRPSK
jgi:hypothetical protein